MTPSPLDASHHQAARLAGAAFLVALAIVVLANYGISFRLVVPGEAAATARNIQAHETLFRLNIACDLIYAVTLLAQVAALYVILRPVQKTLALVAALSRLIFALMWAITALNMLGALRILGTAAYLPAFAPSQLQALARLHLSASYDTYYVGLPFWGLASTLCGYLWLRSRYIPRALAAYGLIVSAWGVFCAFTFLVFPHFDATVGASWFDLPLVTGELAWGFWLLTMGTKEPAAALPAL